jgi:hypothetical protein
MIAAGTDCGRVSIGRDCYLGSRASLTHAIVGAGVRIGKDGFGFAMRSKGTPRYPRLGALLSAIMSRLGPTRRSIGEHYQNHRAGHQDRQSRADCPQRRDRATLHSCAQIAGMAHVNDDVEAGARMGGTPARRPLPRPSDRPRSTRSRRPHVVGRSGRPNVLNAKGS